MQQTTNYQLPIYETNDVTSWLTVFNNAMQAIDTAIFNAKSEADQASASIATLSTTVGTHTTAIESLTSSLGTVATDLLTVTGALNTITALIGNGEPTTTDKTIIGAINELHADIQGLADPDASDVDYDNTTSGLTATNVQSAIDELANGSGGTVEAEDVSYDNTISGLTATNVQSAIDEVLENSGVKTASSNVVDLSAHSSSSNVYTVPKDGFITARIKTGTQNGLGGVYRNGVTVMSVQGVNVDIDICNEIQVKKGDTIYYDVLYNAQMLAINYYN